MGYCIVSGGILCWGRLLLAIERTKPALYRSALFGRAVCAALRRAVVHPSLDIKKMTVLFLYEHIGEGHKKAALALGEHLRTQGVEVHHAEVVRQTYPKIFAFSRGVYLFMLRYHPRLWEF